MKKSLAETPPLTPPDAALETASGTPFGLFPREQRSLFGEILDWMLTPLLLLWPLSLALTWLVAQGIASKPYDRALEFNLQALAQFVSVEDAVVRFELGAQARDLLRADDTDRIYYQVLDAEGHLVSGEPTFPLPDFERAAARSAPSGTLHLRDDVLRGEPVRVAYTWVVRGHETPQRVLLQVAETRGKRAMLATEIIKGVMVPQFVILPLAVLLVWLALVRGIRPLNDLERRIRERRPDDLSPLDEEQVPQEVAPLVSSINDLLLRLKASVSNQKRFLADAAHQLKTPLAGLRMQAEMAQQMRHLDDGDIQRSLQQIAKSSMRATHTVNQLLALARAETSGRSLPKVPFDLAETVTEALEDAVPRALERAIDLGYEGPSQMPAGCLLQGNPTLISELVRNLIDNALRYTPAGGVVTVRVLFDRYSGVQLLQVEDDGPGIPQAERTLVLEPFYRALGTNVDGSGLGLAIVQEIATQHQATLQLEDSFPARTQRRGLRVAVRFGLPVPGGDGASP